MPPDVGAETPLRGSSDARNRSNASQVHAVNYFGSPPLATLWKLRIGPLDVPLCGPDVDEGFALRRQKLHAVGSEVLAWLGWLLALPGSIATKAAAMNASEWAAWVQAVFSLVAIGVIIWQNFVEKRRRERDRDDRAMVVAAQTLRLARRGRGTHRHQVGAIGSRIERTHPEGVLASPLKIQT